MEKFARKLDKIAKKAKKYEQGVELEFSDLFSTPFMQQNSDFNSIEEFFEKSPFEFSNQEEFSNINLEQLDNYVNENTNFSNWEEMKSSAAAKLVLKDLFG